MSGRPDMNELRGRLPGSEPWLAAPLGCDEMTGLLRWVEAVEDVLRLYVQTRAQCHASFAGWACVDAPGHDGDHHDGIGPWSDTDEGATPSPWTAERLAVLHAVTNPEEGQ